VRVSFRFVDGQDLHGAQPGGGVPEQCGEWLEVVQEPGVRGAEKPGLPPRLAVAAA
jgi:hypothetical protein